MQRGKNGFESRAGCEPALLWHSRGPLKVEPGPGLWEKLGRQSGQNQQAAGAGLPATGSAAWGAVDPAAGLVTG